MTVNPDTELSSTFTTDNEVTKRYTDSPKDHLVAVLIVIWLLIIMTPVCTTMAVTEKETWTERFKVIGIILGCLAVAGLTLFGAFELCGLVVQHFSTPA